MSNEQTLLDAVHWRLAGPFRGGRVVAVAGHPIDPLTYYFGACSGGVWKTSDAGRTWNNVSDGYFKTASVGAIAIAESDPNIIYAGMGESCIRGNVSHGDGVYKSYDGGQSWTHCGLEATRHIARVRVHPKDPNLVYVAAFGHAFGHNPERGIFRSKDGGQTWEHVLFRNEQTGAADLCMDPNNPRVLYAALWEAQRYPYQLISGGEGSGIFKTTDGGDTWTELTNNPGLPAGLKGRIGVAVSPANSKRVWAVIEAEAGGLYRSDDGGSTWKLMSDSPDLRQRPWYYMHLFADPVEAETVYCLNLGMWKSTDGGSTFKEIPTPHGDNHDLWIDPTNTQRMIEGNDGGANVSFNGGVTWSTIYNQPTAQFYHVITDNQFPYRIYGAQQDNSTISVPSYSDGGAITNDECFPVGGGESGYIAIDPRDPNIIYAGSYASRMTRYDHRSNQEVDITVWPDDPIGYGAEAMKYRFQWTFPIVISPHDPDVLYATGNHVMRSRSGGQQWEEASPDLTRGDPETLGSSGGPITKDNVSTEYYGTVFAFAESLVQAGVLWAGSDDGMVHVSRDGGENWTNVTPQLLPDWSLISIIEPSPHDPATAYVAATCYKMDDFRPYFLKTNDYGESWHLITNGIRENDFSRAIREDPVRRGLLYAGTETGLYVSWDGGENWHAIGGDFPVVPIHDLVVHDTDLVVATHGRAFWVLDDLTMIRAWPETADNAPATLFKPRPTYRLQAPRRWGEDSAIGYKNYGLGLRNNEAIGEIVSDGGGKTVTRLLTAGDNAPLGVMVNYRVSKSNAKSISISFHDAQGNLIRKFPDGDTKVPGDSGFHRFMWDMRYPDATRLPGSQAGLSGYWGGSTIGPEAVPGEYEVRLEVDGAVESQRFTILKDPRVSASQEELQAQFDLLIAIRDKLTEVHEAVLHSRGLREQIGLWQKRLSESGQADLAEEAGEVAAHLLGAEGELVESRSQSTADVFNYPPKVNRKLASLQSTVAYGQSRPPQQCYDVFNELGKWADRDLAKLRHMAETEVTALNQKLGTANVAAIG